MQTFQKMHVVTMLLAVLGGGNLSVGQEKAKTPDKEKGTVHTVTASVGYPTNAGVGIQAEKQPGSFTIPKGSQATKLKYSFADPKSDYTSTKLRGSNIYSVTEKRYMHELDHNPDFALPPGEYKFVVGGLPGAMGSLTYTVVSSTDVDPPPGGTPPHPPTRKPPTGTSGKDTTKTGSGPDALHPGGEGKRKVTLRVTANITGPYGTTTGGGDFEATLAVSRGRFVLDCENGGFSEHWDGTLTRQGETTVVNGTITRGSSGAVIEGQRIAKWKTTFSGKLAGTALKGTRTGRSDGNPPLDEKGEWSIKDFAR